MRVRSFDFFSLQSFLILFFGAFFAFLFIKLSVLPFFFFKDSCLDGSSGLSPAWVFASLKEISPTNCWVAILILFKEPFRIFTLSFFWNYRLQSFLCFKLASSTSPETDKSVEDGPLCYRRETLTGIGMCRFKDGKKVFTNILNFLFGRNINKINLICVYNF